MKKLTYALLFITIFFSCKSETSSSLETNQKLNNIFSKEEIVGLTKILDFFDKEVCRIEGQSSSKDLKCYDSFFERMLKAVTSSGTYEIGIPLENQIELNKEITNILNEEIWTTNTRRYQRQRLMNGKMIAHPDTFQVIQINPQGKFMEFIKQLSSEDKGVKQYYESFSFTQDISPLTFAEVIKDYKNFDISNDSVRLLIAVHYLTLNYENSLRGISNKKLDEILKSNQ